jgi:hypothetical protein
LKRVRKHPSGGSTVCWCRPHALSYFSSAAVAAVGYFSIHRQSTARIPNRLLFYSTTIAWEWILIAYIYWGLRRRGKFIRNIAGKSWTSASAFSLDIAIAFGFWIAAIFVLSIVARLSWAGMAEPRADLLRRSLFDRSTSSRSPSRPAFARKPFSRLPATAVCRWTPRPSGASLRGAVWRRPHLSRQKRRLSLVYGLMFGILAEAWQNLRPGIMTRVA